MLLRILLLFILLNMTSAPINKSSLASYISTLENKGYVCVIDTIVTCNFDNKYIVTTNITEETLNYLKNSVSPTGKYFITFDNGNKYTFEITIKEGLLFNVYIPKIEDKYAKNYYDDFTYVFTDISNNLE